MIVVNIIICCKVMNILWVFNVQMYLWGAKQVIIN